MLKKTASGLTAQKLRLILVATIALLILLAAAGFVYVRNTLASYSAEVYKLSATADASSKDLQALNNLKETLEENKAAVDRTKALVADSKSYQYQDQIIRDINKYAAQAQIGISGYTFNSVAAATPGAAGSSSSASPASGAAGTTGEAATTTPVDGLKSVSVSVSLQSPVKYTNIMQFIHLIEKNLTKMQLAGVSLTKDPQSSDLTASALTIEVYTR